MTEKRTENTSPPDGAADDMAADMAAVAETIVEATQTIERAVPLFDGVRRGSPLGAAFAGGPGPNREEPADQEEQAALPILFLDQFMAQFSALLAQVMEQLLGDLLAAFSGAVFSPGSRQEAGADSGADSVTGAMTGATADSSALPGGESDVESDPQVVRARQVREAITRLNEEHQEETDKTNEAQAQSSEAMWGLILDSATDALAQLGRKNQAAAIAQTVMDTARGVQKAFAEVPFPANIAQAAIVAAKGAVNIAKIKGAFHAGIDRVPSSGTYLLERGERVLDQRLNADLKGFLRQGGAQTTTNSFAPQITVQGSVDDMTLQKMEQMLRDIHAEQFSTGFA